LHIAHNIINREEMQNIEKKVEDQNKVLKEKCKKSKKYNKELEKAS